VVKRNAAPEFSPEIMNDIAESLPTPRSKRHRDLLSRILREWSHNELREHLSMEPRAITRDRMNKLEAIKSKAGKLLEAFDAIDESGRTLIVTQIVAEKRRLEGVSRGDFANQAERLDEVQDVLAKLAAFSPSQFLKSRPGQPRNLAAYLVLQDAAAIFEWFSGRKAARGVNPIRGAEAGPFFRFAAALWPAIFGKGIAGLPAAMKNWASARSRFNERSALIANMAMCHPEWGIFNR
jgi:hypothetical protein